MKKQKTLRKQLIEDLDLLVSKIVIKRDKACVQCNKKYGLTCGHLITRKRQSTRFDLNNCFVQCHGCNLGHMYDFTLYLNWYINRFGFDEYKKLYEKSRITNMFTDQDLIELLDSLNDIYTTLNEKD